jgi:[protein-PII] uridylyltransferase
MNLKASMPDTLALLGEGDSWRIEEGSFAASCQNAYALEMQRLKWRHWNGAPGSATAVGRGILMDRLISVIWETFQKGFEKEGPPLAASLRNATWIALGEYGRLDLAPYSPVDVLLLVKSPLKVESGSALERLLGVLQSLPSEVRVLVLTAKECLQRAQGCFPFCFGLLGARRIAGDPAAFHDLVQRSRANMWKNQLPFFFEMSDYLNAARTVDSVSLLESDLKLDAGGLLEIYAFENCMKVLVGSDQPHRILAQGAVDVREWKQLDEARQHLALIRNHLHFLEGKRQDRFIRERVPEVSEFLRYRSRPPAVASGLLLRDTLRHRRRVHQIVSRFVRRAKARSSAGSDSSKLRYLKLTPPASPDVEEATGRVAGPEHWMKLFRFGQTEPALFNDELEEALLSPLAQWNVHSLNSAAIHAEFRLILKQKGKVGLALRKMRDLGFLGRYLPEFGWIECLPQLDRPRKYTVDEQILRTLDALDALATSSSPTLHDYQRMFEQVVDSSLLYLALLLKDLGRQLNPEKAPRHEALAAKVLRRLNVDREGREKVLLLVRERHLLSEVSQRRDIEDPFLLQEVCDTVETADNLNMLLLLTYSELHSLEEDGWNERKDFLLWSLYFKVYDRLMFGDEISEPEYAQVAAIQQSVLERLGHEFDVDTILRHFLMLPEKYALYTPLPQILSHVRLCEQLQERPVLTLWTPHPQAGYTELLLATHDVPGRFAQIAGTLASQGISILSAQLNTREDKLVIDTFQVSDAQGNAIVDPEIKSRVDRLLAEVISGERDLEKLLAQRSGSPEDLSSSPPSVPRIRIDNEIASQSTVIEVQTQDRPGLGYKIAKTLADLGLNILSAKLATERNHAFDVFYVQTREGEKVTSSFQMTEILERLRFRLK